MTDTQPLAAEEPTKHSHDVLLPAQPCPICDDPWHTKDKTP
jgi:hypothetical protein